MRIAFFLSTLGGSPLQCGLDRGLVELGHHVEGFRLGATYDLILVFNQCAHVRGYEYPEFPTDKTPVAFVDSAEYGWSKRYPSVIHQYWNAFAPGSVSHDTKNAEQQGRLREFLYGRSFPYFTREYFKAWTFSPEYHPIDYPLYHSSLCDKKPDREEYLRRSVDLSCLWGLSHPLRGHLTRVLKELPGKNDVYAIEQDGPRIPQAEYFRRMEASRCTVTFDGYGSSAFRLTEGLVRAPLLLGPLSIKLRKPLVDGETCIEYAVESKEPHADFISTNIGEKLLNVLSDPERAFDIYQRGHDHCMTHYTEKETARYVLETVDKHDWNRPTWI